MSGSIIGSISDRPLQTQQAAKRRLRQIVRERYAAADRARLKVASDHVMQALEQLPEFIAARCVALYWSLPERWRRMLLPKNGATKSRYCCRLCTATVCCCILLPAGNTWYNGASAYGNPIRRPPFQRSPARRFRTRLPNTRPTVNHSWLRTLRRFPVQTLPRHNRQSRAELTGSGPRSRPDRRTCRRIRPARQPARPRQRLLRQVAPGHTGIESRYLFRFSAFRAYSGRRARRPDGPDHRRLPGRKRALPL